MLENFFHAIIEKNSKYGSIPNTIDIVKFAAIIIMVCDHLGAYFFVENLWFRAVGRIGFPIWFFFAGYSRPGKFSYEIYVLFAIIAIVKTAVFLPTFPVNALASIIICRLYVDYLRKDNRFMRWKLLNVIVIFISLLVWVPLSNVMFEYGSLALMFAICGLLQRERPGHLHTSIAFVFSTVAFILIEQLYFKFSVAQFALMASGTLVVTHLLSGLKMIQFQSLNKFSLVAKTGMFLARNSLYFYFIHIILFAILSKIIFPERYMFFKWL